MNNIRNQELSKDLRIDSALSLAPIIQENPITHLEDMSTRDKSTLNVILGIFSTTHINYIFPSLEYICKKTKSSASTVKRSLRRLCEKGFISKYQRGFNMSNRYRVHTMFLDPDVREELRFVFRCFYFIPISILMVHDGWAKVEKDAKHYVYSKRPLDHAFNGLTPYQVNRNKFIYNTLPPTTTLPSTKKHFEVGNGGDGFCKKEIVQSKGMGGSSKRCTSKPVRDGSVGGIISTQERVKVIKVSDYKRILKLNTTRVGTIKLMAFPVSAIAAALSGLRVYKGQVNDLYSFVYSAAKRWCLANNITPDEAQVKYLLAQEKLDRNGPTLDAIKPCELGPDLEAERRDTRTNESLEVQHYQPSPESRKTWETTMELMDEVQTEPGSEANFNSMRDHLKVIAKTIHDRSPEHVSGPKGESVRAFYQKVMDERRAKMSKAPKPFSMD